MKEMEWSKKEKDIARHAFRTAYERECLSIAVTTRKMADEINEPSDLWKIHDFLTKKREETDRKYDYCYSILLSLFARLLCEGWIKEIDLIGLSEDKLQEIHRIVEFFFREKCYIPFTHYQDKCIILRTIQFSETRDGK